MSEDSWANENSMLYWYPKIASLNIPQPKTKIYQIPLKVLKEMVSENMGTLDMDTVRKIAGEIGYPLFVRTDQASGKHGWKRTCFVEKEEDLKSHIFEVISENLMADIMGLPYRALVFREYIQMDNLFTAFYGDMPVNPEIRFFARYGKIECQHWYWVKEAINNPSILDWKEVLDKTAKDFGGLEAEELLVDAERVASEFKGYWSIDFCRGKNKKWYLIDMAKGEESYHDTNCSNYKTIVR